MSIHRKDPRSSTDHKNGNDDIDSKIADFMADIDEIVLGKKSNNDSQQSEWQQCFDETTQAIYYWNTETNECTWDPPPTLENHRTTNELNNKKRSSITTDSKSPKKLKKTSLIAEYASSESESSEEEEEEENVEDIDELLEEVLEKEDKPTEKLSSVDLYPLFETDYRAAIARLSDLGDRSKDILTLRIQLETRLEDCLAGHLSKSYAVSKLEEVLVQIDELENLHLTKHEPSKSSLTTSQMALLLSLPPPPPPPSPPPALHETDPSLQTFYTQLNSDTEKVSHHHHQHKEKKSKPAKTLPTDLIQKWTHARQELRSTIPDLDDS